MDAPELFFLGDNAAPTATPVRVVFQPLLPGDRVEALHLYLGASGVDGLPLLLLSLNAHAAPPLNTAAAHAAGIPVIGRGSATSGLRLPPTFTALNVSGNPGEVACCHVVPVRFVASHLWRFLSLELATTAEGLDGSVALTVARG